MIWATVSSWFCFCWLSRASPSRVLIYVLYGEWSLISHVLWYYTIGINNFSLNRKVNMIFLFQESESVSHAIVSGSLWPHGLQLTSKFHLPWNSPGKDTGVDGHSFLQGIFPTQRFNLDLLHCRWTLYHLSHECPVFLSFLSSLWHHGCQSSLDGYSTPVQLRTLF